MVNATLKKNFLKLLFFLNILLLILLFFSEFAAYFNPAEFWIIALLGLAYPVLLASVLLFAIFWLFVNRKKAVFSALILIIGLPAIFHSFAFNLKKDFTTKQKDNIRIITWNVGLMSLTATDTTTAIKQNSAILNQLKTLDADVICMQEFFTAVLPENRYNFIDSISKTMGYPYHYFSFDNPYFSNNFYSGSIIFSKYKIVDTGRYAFSDSSFGSLIKTRLLAKNDTIDVFTTRLQSMGFQPYEYEVIDNIKSGENNAFRGSGNIIRKLKKGYAKKGAQVRLVKDLLKQDQNPIIFAGDFNDVPTSYAYNTIKGDMQDAWLNNGLGIGRTFKFISPTLRIDYILYNHFFTSAQTKRIITIGSDHYGLVTDLTIKKAVE